MARIDPDTAGRTVLAEYLNAHPRAYTRSDLLAHWPRSALDAALRTGDVERILPGVYAGAQQRAEARVMGEAVHLWHPRAAMTGQLALSMRHARIPAPRVADIRVTNGRRPRTPAWVRCHQGDPVTRIIRPSGVPCVMPEVAVLDWWAVAGPATRRDAVYEALWVRACTWRELRRALGARPRLPGRPELAKLLEWFADGATSPLECRARHETFVGPAFRALEWQVPLNVAGRRVVVDVLHREAKVVIELDGARFHAGAAARERDRERDTLLLSAGFVTIRFGWNEIVRRPQWCRDQVMAIVRRRLAAPSGT